MTVQELIDKLQQFDPNENVKIGYMDYAGGEYQFVTRKVEEVDLYLDSVVITDDKEEMEIY